MLVLPSRFKLAAAPLRLLVGDVVACCMDSATADWRVGVVLETWYRGAEMPRGACAAYAVGLDEFGGEADSVEERVVTASLRAIPEALRAGVESLFTIFAVFGRSFAFSK